MKSTQKSTLKTQKQFETDVSTDAGKSLVPGTPKLLKEKHRRIKSKSGLRNTIGSSQRSTNREELA